VKALILILISLLLLAACGEKETDPSSTSKTPLPLATLEEESFPAWNFTLTGLDGQSYTLSTLQGQWVLLNFWATWCTPCVAEMPILQQTSEDYADTLVVLGINVREAPDVIIPFLAEHGITYLILLTPNDTAGNQVLTDYQAVSLPQSVLIAPNGEIVWRQFGELELATFTTTLMQLMNDFVE
jgi:thiol-disulfide isomerase/thioredoxin